MLEDYTEFFKLSNIQDCSIYTALRKRDSKAVLLKRLPKSTESWNDVLTNRSLQFMHRSRMFPRIVEIFRCKGHFYIVYERPAGECLSAKIQKQWLEWCNIMACLCEYGAELREYERLAWVVREWIFTHRQSVLLVHFQPYTPPGGISSQHVYQFSINPEQPALKVKNMVKELGIIACQLFASEISDPTPSQAQKLIYRHTQSLSLAQTVSQMLNPNPFLSQSLRTLAELFKHQYQSNAPPNPPPKSTNKVQFSLQQIKFEPAQSLQTLKKRKRRQCCAQTTAQQVHTHRLSTHVATGVIGKIDNTRKSTLSKNCSKQKSGLFPEVKKLKTRTEANERQTKMTRPMALGRRAMGEGWAAMLGRGSI